jgi:hypothetical protein
MTPKAREWFLRATIVFGSIFFCLVVLEVMVRVIEPREVMRYFFVQPDSVLNHKFIPNAKGRYKTSEYDTQYEINSLGLRDKEYSIEKPAGTIRLLMVGDSFTEGDGVESHQTFSKILEQRLNSEGRREKYEVINAGCASYSPLPEYLYLKTAGLHLHPDIVVLNLDLSDVHDDIHYTKLARFDSADVPFGIDPYPELKAGGWFLEKLVAVKDFLKNNARLYNFIRLRISRYLESIQRVENETGEIEFDKYGMLRENYNSKDRTWFLTYKYVLLIRDMLRERNVPLIVAVYPYGLQVSPREYNSGRQFWGFKLDTVYSTEPQEWLAAFCQRESILVVNACDDFRSAARTRYPLYIDYNGHWTPSGHEVFADVLARELEKQVLSMWRQNAKFSRTLPIIDICLYADSGNFKD